MTKQALIKVKQGFHKFIADYKKNGYKSIPNNQPNIPVNFKPKISPFIDDLNFSNLPEDDLPF